jgi:SAM-dependent methyltransferase
MHTAAERGFAAAASIYRRGRPDYPRELLGWLRDDLHLGPGRRAIDLGAGTGKFTRLLVETQAEILAIEPVDAMRAELAAELQGVRSLSGTAQRMPTPDASVDTVLCAQSFHWFASIAALAEIHRVLRPGGMLGLVWNVRDESVSWVAALSALLTPHEGDAPRFQSGQWRGAFASGLFTDLIETRFTHRHVGSPREVILERCLSVSFIAALPLEARTRFAGQLEHLVATHPELAGRAVIELPYVTRAFRCTRLSGAGGIV